MTEYEKMQRGEVYLATDPSLLRELHACQDKCWEYNRLCPTDARRRNFTVLDEARVSIGDDCFIGPNVSIYTACHSTDPVERNTRREWAEPVTIGDNCWIGGSSTILPGVTIGDNVTIGAGSVVVKDIPSNSVAVGNPARVVRTIKAATTTS